MSIDNKNPMKTLKTLLVLVFGLIVANAAFALEDTGATVSTVSVSGSGYGSANVKIVGASESFTFNACNSTDGGDASSIANVNTLSVGCGITSSGNYTAIAYLTIPTGATGTAVRVCSSYGTVQMTIGSSTYTSAGSTTLSPGTYLIKTYVSYGGSGTTGGNITVTITFDE